jgi:hypothetical protein
VPLRLPVFPPQPEDPLTSLSSLCMSTT